jgi:hypothetical protein
VSSTFALVRLYDAVVARFADEGSGPESPAEVAQPFGWRETPKQKITAGRIVWTPGDATGALGAIGPAKQPGRVDARPLASLGELFTCTISAVNTSTPEDDTAQYTATRALFDAWYRAVYLAARGTFSIVSAEWLSGNPTGSVNVRRHGAAIRVVVQLDAAILDAPIESAPTDTAALVTSTMDSTDDEAPENIEAAE